MIVEVVGTLMIVALVIVVGRYIDKRVPKIETVSRRNLPDGNVEIRIKRPGPPQPPGDTPATAIRAGAAQTANLRAGQRCRECRAQLESDGPDEELRYADRTLLLLTFRCPTCSRKRSLYVEPTA